MTLDRESVVETLNELIRLNKDSAKGFVRAENDVEDEALAQWFNQLTEKRAELVDDLQRAVDRIGEEPEDEASTGGALARGWLNIKAAMTIERDKTDAIVLEDRMDHEAEVLEAYESALAESYPASIDEMLQAQRAYLSKVRQALAERWEEVKEEA